MSGHDLVREIIAKHGVDRYPTVELSVMKLMEELGELTSELLRVPMPNDESRPVLNNAIRSEFADVGISLYALGNVLGLNLETEMRKIVDSETRRFA